MQGYQEDSGCSLEADERGNPFWVIEDYSVGRLGHPDPYINRHMLNPHMNGRASIRKDDRNIWVIDDYPVEEAPDALTLALKRNFQYPT